MLIDRKWGERLCAAVAIAALSPAAANGAVEYVVHISFDGFRPDAVTVQGAAAMPNFYRLRAEGAFTDNARTDFDYTTTLQNHTSMLTGRPVFGPQGHFYLGNGDPPQGQTLHTNKGSYVASAFDVAHDNDRRTGLFATKSKFSLYYESYGPDATPLHGGAADTTGVDTGHNKVDVFRYDPSSANVVSAWAEGMNSCVPFGYSFLHFQDTDAAGHSYGWDVTDPDGAYLTAARNADTRLGEVLATINASPTLKGHTAVVVTADHGGTAGTFNHGDPAEPQDYTVPVYVWGAGVTPGDLYALSAGTRFDPGTDRPDYNALMQPIRNGDTGNLALSLLGLGPIPGSTITAPLTLVIPEPTAVLPIAILAIAGFGRRRVRGV